MMGKLFALTSESAAEKRNSEGLTEAKYRGQASEDFQVQYFGKLKTGTVPEGEAFWAPVRGSAKDLIETFLGSLRSALTYGGSRDIKELQRKAEFVEGTPAMLKENSTRRD